LRSGALDFDCRLDFDLRSIAESDQLPLFMNRQASTLGSGHFVFETTFRPEGELLGKPLPLADADDGNVLAQHAFLLNTPLADLGTRRSTPHSLAYQYSEYQSHAGMQWRMCICIRKDYSGRYCVPDVSVALEYGGPTEDGGSSRPSTDVSNMKAHVWFAGTYSDEATTSTSNTALKKMNHTFGYNSPSVWTEPMCLSCPWSTSSGYSEHANLCGASLNRDPASVISATSFEFEVVLFLDGNYPLDASLGTNLLDRAAGTRWPHRLYMLDDPEGSSADVVLRSSDNTTIRTHQCVLSSYAFFKAMFTAGYKEGSDGEAQFSDLSKEGMRLMVDWTYGARMPYSLRQNARLLVELWMFASVHGMNDMAEACSSIAIAAVDNENFVCLFSTAMKLSDKDTARKLTRVVKGSADQIIDWMEEKCTC
jgi:BTB/POZ domain